MKVRSLGLGLLLLLPSAKALANTSTRYFDFDGNVHIGRSINHTRNNPRWSIVEGERISPYLHYSPYAFGLDHNGIVPNTAWYSPYAFGVHHSGLVDNVNLKDASKINYLETWPTDTSQQEYDPEEHQRNLDEVKERDKRKRSLYQLKKDQRDYRNEFDGKTIIKNHLGTLGIDFYSRSGFYDNNEIVSASFIVGNTLLGYLDPEKISRLSNHKMRILDREVRKWNVSIEKNDYEFKLIQEVGKNEILGSLNEIVSSL